MHGEFIIHGPNGKERLPNTITVQSEQAFLREMFRGEVFLPVPGGNFYLGLCGLPFSINNILTDLVGEPVAGTGGYARQAIVRNVGSWTLAVQNNVSLMRSIVVNFTPVGVAYSTPIRRMFLTTAAAGTGGLLFAVSAPFSADRVVSPAAPLAVQYEFHLRS